MLWFIDYFLVRGDEVVDCNVDDVSIDSVNDVGVLFVKLI